ncbi:hypothetical protein EPUS_09042 [Endocarpon pusillum Z07020]|uniref:Uncharacterized protein n=1 Tax=Endocarpon pusillum (strain Z07020 / HMAS-L-300199) TaxID=1263415 RepID=U1GGR2_ENDPU|nr:uncharacterized protein EPUS_09042 [Endocarpon pusillum Z07020]ERF70971.1 hypothetical protein EPUS_09042 [Endocarpon pusillum Z07020]
MVVIPSTAVGTTSAVLALSKAAWKLGISLSKLDHDTRIVDTTVDNLARKVKSLGNECDLVYAELEGIISQSQIGSAPYDIDDRIWNCLATQVEETSQTIQELELFVKSVRGEDSGFIGQAQRQKKLDKTKNQIASIRTKVCRHTDNLRTTLLLIHTVLAHIAPCQADQGLAKELDKLQDVVEKLQRSSEANPHSRPSHTEATLLQCTREVIVKGTTVYEASLAAQSITGGRGATNSNIRAVEWMSTLESIRRDERLSDPSDMVSNVSSIFSGNETYTVVTSATSEQSAVQEDEAVDAVGDDSDDDLDTDLAKAALDTGAKAFEAQEWEEADSLLQEALRILQQLPKQQRAFCDIFGLHYKLAVCAYHTQEPADAEEALMGLVQQSASSDEQRRCISDAAHLLSHLYIRMGQVDRARSECKKALQTRRRLLGKRSDASLESTALMAHIYVLLNNHARAKLCLAMIPEARRDAVLKIVEESLGTKFEHLDSSSPLTRSISEDSDLAVKRFQNRLPASSLVPMEISCHGPVSTMISPSPTAGLRQSHQRIPSSQAGWEDLQSVTVASRSPTEEGSESRATVKERLNEDHTADSEALGGAALSLGESPEANKTFRRKTLSRKEILDKIGCQPRDRIEDAVCDGDHSALASLLNGKREFWRSKLRKRGRPERVTALHFAALFGEIDMARRLLDSSFNINEVPHGYSTSLTPLKFAIGARQVNMVEFLVANGAKPSEPDSWSTLAGQLMNRSWLMKTMSEAEKEYVPDRITAILRILLKHGWNVNAPFETSGGTVLHQAVTFWTGSYTWDLNLRAAVTLFLCQRGADPFQANKEGKTPYDMALASGHQDLLLVLDRGSKMKLPDDRPPEPVELPSELPSELSDVI